MLPEVTPPAIHVTTRAVVIADDHLLLAYDPQERPFHYYEMGKTFYYLPGGHIEHNESASLSVLREIEEETGFQGKLERFLGILEHAWQPTSPIPHCHTHEINLVFKVTIPALTAPLPIPQQESHVAFAWERIDRLPNIDLRPHQLKNTLPTWLAHDFNGAFDSTILKTD